MKKATPLAKSSHCILELLTRASGKRKVQDSYSQSNKRLVHCGLLGTTRWVPQGCSTAMALSVVCSDRTGGHGVLAAGAVPAATKLLCLLRALSWFVVQTHSLVDYLQHKVCFTSSQFF